jgi:hypothetical protein
MYSNIINLIGNSIVANTILHARTPEKERGGKNAPPRLPGRFVGCVARIIGLQ